MPISLRGECRTCGTPLSYFALSCPGCRASNQPNPVATIAALSAIVLASAIIALGYYAFRSASAPPAPQEAQMRGHAATDTVDNYGWIVQAMAECEVEAKQQLDRLHFLVVPLTATGLSLPGWSPNPIGDIGADAKLVGAGDAMIGLRNGALILYPKPIIFLVSDPATRTVYKWKPAVGVAALNASYSFEKVTLGLELPDVSGEVQWGPTVNITKGTCYWINPLITVP
jgi:hypothetical protein